MHTYEGCFFVENYIWRLGHLPTTIKAGDAQVNSNQVCMMNNQIGSNFQFIRRYNCDNVLSAKIKIKGGTGISFDIETT